MAKYVNTFNQGLDRDSSKNKYDNLHYYDASNIRVMTQDGLSSGAIQNMKGQQLKINFSGKIVGHTILGDSLILFTTSNLTSTPSPSSTDRIWRFDISDIEALSGGSSISPSVIPYHSGGNLIYSGNLQFCAANEIDAVPRYENDNVQKVYWVDGYNSLRYINTIYDADTNDLTNLPEDKLNVLGNFDDLEETVSVDEIVDGNLQTGRVQYAYQLYKINGCETVFSDACNLFNIVGPSDFESDTRNYRGSDIETNTGKGLRCSIDLTALGYNRIRVVAIHYTSILLDPEIRIVEETDISSDSAQTVYFIDTGESLGNYTLEEFRVVSTYDFAAEHLQTKDNILFPSNITTKEWDVEYDARAYRFAGTGTLTSNRNYNGVSSLRGISIIYEEDDSYYKIYSAGLTRTGVGGLSSDGDWEYYNSSGVYQGVWGTDYTIPATADVINKFNELANSGNYSYWFSYQVNGDVYGGTGPNVSYGFNTRDTIIRDTFTDTDEMVNLLEGSADNPSYYSYASPYNSQKYVGYQRDETYRFGIVFFNEKGQSSFVKWIGDIRMPTHSDVNKVGEDELKMFSNSGSDVWGNVLYPTFTVNNIPSEAVAYQIVRVRREADDRSVIGQGMISYPILSSGTTLTTTIFTNSTSAYDFFMFSSPETCFNNNQKYRAGDYFENVGVVASTYTEPPNTSGKSGIIHYGYVIPQSNPQLSPASASPGDLYHANERTDLASGTMVNQTDGVVKLNSTYSFNVNNDTADLDKSRCFIAEADNASWSSYGDAYTARKVVNHRREVFNTQYGGNTYNARTRNQYIKASEPVDVATSSVACYGGDTYLTMFEFLHNSQEEGSTVGSAPFQYSVLYPCESSINCELRLDSMPSKIWYTDYHSMMRDDAGIYQDSGATNEYIQEVPLYTYNTVYSKENDSKLFLAKPFGFTAENQYRTRTLASQLKTNGELVDSWLKYPSLQYIDVDPQFGDITGLEVVNEKLIFFQPKAFGVLSVNERALLQTQDISSLVLGSSGLLERFDYAKRGIGMSYKRSKIQTPNGLYWVDYINKAMFKFTQGPEEVSLMKGLDGWFRTNVQNMNIRVFHDPEFKEVYARGDDGSNDWTVVFNELTDSFISFVDFHPDYVINYNEKTLSSNTNTSDGLYRHNDDDASMCSFYGTIYPSYVTLLVSPNGKDIVTYNNMEWLTEVYDSSGNDIQETYGKITMWNDYQHTGEITLTPQTNVKRRMRKWRYTTPRARYELDGATPLSIRDARLRDSHLFVKLEFTNADDKKFIGHDIITSYMESNK